MSSSVKAAYQKPVVQPPVEKVATQKTHPLLITALVLAAISSMGAPLLLAQSAKIVWIEFLPPINFSVSIGVNVATWSSFISLSFVTAIGVRSKQNLEKPSTSPYAEVATEEVPQKSIPSNCRVKNPIPLPPQISIPFQLSKEDLQKKHAVIRDHIEKNLCSFYAAVWDKLYPYLETDRVSDILLKLAEVALEPSKSKRNFKVDSELSSHFKIHQKNLSWVLDVLEFCFLSDQEVGKYPLKRFQQMTESSYFKLKPSFANLIVIRYVQYIKAYEGNTHSDASLYAFVPLRSVLTYDKSALAALPYRYELTDPKNSKSPLKVSQSHFPLFLLSAKQLCVFEKVHPSYLLRHCRSAFPSSPCAIIEYWNTERLAVLTPKMRNLLIPHLPTRLLRALPNDWFDDVDLSSMSARKLNALFEFKKFEADAAEHKNAFYRTRALMHHLKMETIHACLPKLNGYSLSLLSNEQLQSLDPDHFYACQDSHIKWEQLLSGAQHQARHFTSCKEREDEIYTYALISKK